MGAMHGCGTDKFNSCNHSQSSVHTKTCKHNAVYQLKLIMNTSIHQYTTLDCLPKR